MNNSSKKSLLKKLESIRGLSIKSFNIKDNIEEAVSQSGEHFYLQNGKIILFEVDGRLVPSLHSILNSVFGLPKIIVDMGAVRYVARGADIMAPGIRAVDPELNKDDLAVIVDETHGKPLAIGYLILDRNTILNERKGKAVKSLHYVSDKIWNYITK